MDIIDLRTGRKESGSINGLVWNFTIGQERIIITLDTGFKVELYIHELNRIRPLDK